MCTNDNVVHLYNIAENVEIKTFKFPKGLTALEWDPVRREAVCAAMISRVDLSAYPKTKTSKVFPPVLKAPPCHLTSHRVMPGSDRRLSRVRRTR